MSLAEGSVVVAACVGIVFLGATEVGRVLRQEGSSHSVVYVLVWGEPYQKRSRSLNR